MERKLKCRRNQNDIKSVEFVRDIDSRERYFIAKRTRLIQLLMASGTAFANSVWMLVLSFPSNVGSCLCGMEISRAVSA